MNSKRIKAFLLFNIEEIEKSNYINKELKDLYIEYYNIIFDHFFSIYHARYRFLHNIHVRNKISIIFENNKEGKYLICWDELYSSDKLALINTKIRDQLNQKFFDKSHENSIKYKDLRMSKLSSVFDKGLNKGKENLLDLTSANYPHLKNVLL